MLPPGHGVFHESVMATPKLDATLGSGTGLPLAADGRPQGDGPSPKRRENGPALASPEASREDGGAVVARTRGHAPPASEPPPLLRPLSPPRTPRSALGLAG